MIQAVLRLAYAPVLFSLPQNSRGGEKRTSGKKQQIRKVQHDDKKF